MVNYTVQHRYNFSEKYDLKLITEVKRTAKWLNYPVFHYHHYNSAHRTLGTKSWQCMSGRGSSTQKGGEEEACRIEDLGLESRKHGERRSYSTMNLAEG